MDHAQVDSGFQDLRDISANLGIKDFLKENPQYRSSVKYDQHTKEFYITLANGQVLNFPDPERQQIDWTTTVDNFLAKQTSNQDNSQTSFNKL